MDQFYKSWSNDLDFTISNIDVGGLTRKSWMFREFTEQACHTETGGLVAGFDLNCPGSISPISAKGFESFYWDTSYGMRL